MDSLQTERTLLRRLTFDDAAFILELLNDPAFIRFIGDKNARTMDDAREYLAKGPMASYERFGFGLLLTERRADGVPMGICGLLKRDSLPDVDIGFAFLPRFRSSGYAFEAAAAAMEHGKRTLGLRRIVAITLADNQASIRLLERLGMRFEGKVKLSQDDVELDLYAWNG